MESSVKHCIINASDGNKWYPKGTKRLVKSLVYHGFSGDILTWEYWPNNEWDKTNPYHVKLCAFEEAIKLGYTHILWLDCSVWAIKNPDPIFDLINSSGYYMWSSGYNCAQVCSDSCLEYFKISRDQAEKIPDCSSSMIGLNLDNPIASQFINRWVHSASMGQFYGSRQHDNQSQDPRFLFHRQDQSCASIIAHSLGMQLTPPNIYSSYYITEQKESVIFTMRGM
jgi:hypothetical protein